MPRGRVGGGGEGGIAITNVQLQRFLSCSCRHETIYVRFSSWHLLLVSTYLANVSTSCSGPWLEYLWIIGKISVLQVKLSGRKRTFHCTILHSVYQVPVCLMFGYKHTTYMHNYTRTPLYHNMETTGEISPTYQDHLVPIGSSFHLSDQVFLSQQYTVTIWHLLPPPPAIGAHRNHKSICIYHSAMLGSSINHALCYYYYYLYLRTYIHHQNWLLLVYYI